MLGLTLEGGANRTVFSCGVLDALLEARITADYVIGASAGISFGVSYASGQRGRNLIIAKHYISDRRYQGAQHLFHIKNRSFYNLDFVFDEVPNRHVPFDYEAFAAYPGRVVAAVTNVETGEAEYLEVPREDRRFRILRATCALPMLFPIMELDGKHYMDGGIADSIPFAQAMRAGCDKNIVVLTRERSYRKTPEKITAVAARFYQKYPAFVKQMESRPERYNACIDTLCELEREGRVFVIAPEDTLDVGRTESNPERLTALYQQGMRIAKERMEALHAYLSA